MQIVNGDIGTDFECAPNLITQQMFDFRIQVRGAREGASALGQKGSRTAQFAKAPNLAPQLPIAHP